MGRIKKQVSVEAKGSTVDACVQQLETIIKNAINQESQTATRYARQVISDVKRGSLITAAAGFNSAFIKNVQQLTSNHLYTGIVNRVGEKKKILLSVIERDGKITTELMFHDNSEVEEHEVMLINADPIKKLTPFARYPTQEKNIQIIVDLILRNKKLEKFVTTCTCQNEERSKLMSSVGSKRERIAARLRSTLRMDLETMKLLGDLGQMMNDPTEAFWGESKNKFQLKLKDQLWMLVFNNWRL
eukprot:UN02614